MPRSSSASASDLVPALHTCGYEGLALDAFIARLAAARIATLVDVRERPQSRKAGFSKRGLAASLAAQGIGYVHVVELGCPKPVRDRHRADHDWDRYVRDFTAHLATQVAAVDALADRALSERCALMCFEADPARCHRSIVAAAAASRGGLAVVDLGTTVA